MCFVVAEIGEGLEERGEELFVVRIDLGSLFVSAVEIAVGSLTVEAKTLVAAAHNRLVVKKTQKCRGLLLAGMLESQRAVRGNQWAEEGFLRQNQAVAED